MIPRTALISRAVVLTIALAACGGGRGQPSAPAAPPVDAGPATLDRAALAELAASLAEVLGTMAAITDATPDCPTLARQLGELFDRSQPLFELAKAQGDDPVAGPTLTAELDSRAGVVAPLVERISAGLARCRDDRGVMDAMERMPTL